MPGRPIRLPFPSGPLPSGAALLAVRVVMGTMLAYHGYRKLDAGIGKFAATVGRLGFPFPEVLARATVVIELVGGICIALGLLTRLWAALVTTEMLLIIAQVKWNVGLLGPPGRGGGFELDLLYAVSAAALVLAGPGLLACDHGLGIESDPNRAAPEERRAGEARAGT